MAKKVKLYVFIIGMVLFISALASCVKPRDHYSEDEVRALVISGQAKAFKDSLIVVKHFKVYKLPVVTINREVYYPHEANNGTIRYYLLKP